LSSDCAAATQRDLGKCSNLGFRAWSIKTRRIAMIALLLLKGLIVGSPVLMLLATLGICFRHMSKAHP
jgi:hypothetical protein